MNPALFFRNSFFLTLLSLQVHYAFGQNQANIWYFGGNAGVDFNTGVPVPLNNGALNTQEGCSSIADANGNLLFYTDGVLVWNRNHVLMPNGLSLSGNFSSTQSALIVQQPGSQNLYYIFCISQDFQYSIVDMTLNGGMGDVSSKNVMIKAFCNTEKQCATLHANNIDVWVLMHELHNNTFNAYLLTSAGLSSTPVTSNIGTYHGSAYGQMKFSPDGSRIALTVDTTGYAMEIFDFDNVTGVISNNIAVPSAYNSAYGIEFSPDNTKLYCTANLIPPVQIYQFDLSAGTPSAIIASSTLITSQPDVLSALQLGPDGKIYVSQWNAGFLSVISNPNSIGTGCNFMLNNISLNGGLCYLGLPEFVSSYFSFYHSTYNTCLGDSTYLDAGNANLLFGTYWDFGDPSSGANNFSFDFTPAHYYAAPGTYTVQVIYYQNNGSVDTVYQHVFVHTPFSFSLGSDTVICDGSAIWLNAGSGYAGYLWQDGSADSTFLASDSGMYSVIVTDRVCDVSDSLYVSTQPCASPTVALASSDTLFCDKHCIDFFDLSTNSPNSWQWFFPGADSTYSTLQNPTNICYNSYGSFDVTLIACNAIGCDTLVLPGFIKEFSPPASPVITANDDTLFSSSAFTYQWYDINGLIPGATGPFYIYPQPGSYFVVVTDSNGCASTSNVVVTGILNPGAFDGGITILPNPADNMASIEFSLSGKRRGQIKIFNSLGQMVLKKEIVTEQHPVKTKINISIADFTAGIYLVKVEAGEEVRLQKLMITH